MGILLGVAFLADRFTIRHVIGAAIVILGLAAPPLRRLPGRRWWFRGACGSLLNLHVRQGGPDARGIQSGNFPLDDAGVFRLIGGGSATDGRAWFRDCDGRIDRRRLTDSGR